MIEVKTRRRRTQVSFLDLLWKGVGKPMLNGLVEKLEARLRDLAKTSLRRMVLGSVSIGLIVTASVLLLVGGAEGLRDASVPPSLAHLAAGVVGLGVGLGLLYRRP